jgi:hypothetical protein
MREGSLYSSNGIWTWSIYIPTSFGDYDFCSSGVVTGIRTSISGNVLSSLSSVPANDETLTIISLPSKWRVPVARLIARKIFCQFASTSATPPVSPPTKPRPNRAGWEGIRGVLSVPSAKHCNLASNPSICVASAADKSRSWTKFSYSACFSAIRDVRM